MDSDISIDRVRGQTRVSAEETRRMHAALFLDWILDIQQYSDWKVADRRASENHDAQLANGNRDEALVKTQQQHSDATHWHHAMTSARQGQSAKAPLATADVARAQTGQLGPCTAPEQVVRKVGAIEAEMRKGHIFISGTDPHEVEIERLGMADETTESTSEVKHAWQVFMEHQRRDQRRRS